MTPHGHYRTFAAGCRCDICITMCPHGTSTGYCAWKCRCDLRNAGDKDFMNCDGIEE